MRVRPHLDGGDVWGQPQPLVIPVRHDDAAHQPRAHAPAALVHVLLLAGGVKELRAKGLGGRGVAGEGVDELAEGLAGG